jgi:hypothetical protein
LLELLHDVVLVVDEKRVELVGHQLRLLVERNRLCHIFTGKYVCFANCASAHHDLIVFLVLFRKFFKLKVAIGEIHDIIKSLLAYGCEIFWRFELRGVDHEI